MKSTLIPWNPRWLSAVAAAALAGALTGSARAADESVVETRVITEPGDSSGADSEKREHRIVIQKIEKDDSSSKENRQVSWLGIATEETSEALASQLGLNEGEGLLVTYIAHESPAAKAGLQKNDVLVELDGQLLVHPAQLKKLIQKHKDGDSVEITFYRAGKKETVTAKIGKTSRGLSLLGDERVWEGELRDVHRQLSELHLNEAARDQLKNLRQSLDEAGVNREAISKQVRRSMEEVRKALQEALRQATNAHRTFGPAAREFQELARRGMDVEKDATVVVKSKRNSVKSIVKTDDSGTYVVVADPKKQLTAHDKAGRLLFDGPIETSDQQAKVPEAVWEKVKPMLDHWSDDKADSPPAAEDDGT
ncbi:MAG TPA: PDZ domain-containing protein [Verrucomicrobiae bacterium]